MCEMLFRETIGNQEGDAVRAAWKTATPKSMRRVAARLICAAAALFAVTGTFAAGGWCSAMKSRTRGYTFSRQRRPEKMP